MPLVAHGIEAAKVHKTIRLLIDQLVNIKDTTGEFLLRLEDGRVIDTKGWNDWEWTHGIGLYGIWKYYELTGEADLLQIIEDWFKNRFEAGGTTKNINTMAVFLTLAYVYEKTGNQTYLPWLDSWAEWAMYELPRTEYGGMQHVTYLTPNTQQLWDDTLMMTVMPLAKIGKLLNRPHYIEEAKRQFLLHLRYLFDHRTGLFFHGWQFDPSDQGGVGHNFAQARWARGNSWLTIVIPEFLELLEGTGPLSVNSNDDPVRSQLLDTLSAQCKSLSRLQEPSGLWRTLLDHPADEGSYPEASATAGFAYGILKARRKRYLSSGSGDWGKAALYDRVATSAIKAILDNVTEDGELLQVSFGTGMGDSLQFYKEIKKTSMPYGQAMAIMALGEFARVYI
jgi:unsaturated rhamnogalacturonyl hydrolase